MRGCALALALALALASGAVRSAPPNAILRGVEGTVTEVSSVIAEGGLEVVAVRLDTGDPQTGRIDLLLAPRTALDDIEFAVEEGDALRARVFVTESGPFPAHKVMNLTRGTIVRLRTLHAVPLWGAQGEWEGGGSRVRAGHGGGGRGRGSGPHR
jgi:hypothetical protein